MTCTFVNKNEEETRGFVKRIFEGKTAEKIPLSTFRKLFIRLKPIS